MILEHCISCVFDQPRLAYDQREVITRTRYQMAIHIPGINISKGQLICFLWPLYQGQDVPLLAEPEHPL